MRGIHVLSVLVVGAFASALSAEIQPVGARNPASLAVTSEGTDVVIASDAPPAVRLAAEELTNFLSRVLSGGVPIAHEPRAGRTAILLGVNEWSRAAGIDPDWLPRDSFITRVASDRVYLVGRDDPKIDFRMLVEKLGLGGLYALERDGERATLFAVYDFLERFAGVRFYFPGELGTIVPKHDQLSVPEGEFSVTPAFVVRRPYLPRDGTWPGETDDNLSRNTPKSWTWLRQRFSTYRFQCVHGQTQMQLPERFAKTHPEYFALTKEGLRTVDPSVLSGSNKYLKNMVCQSSKVWDEIYLDALAYLKGEDASVRAISDRRRPGRFGWGDNCARRMVDVMPADGMLPCHCAACQAAYAKAEDPKEYATELMWGQTARTARRLIEAGAKGFITQMAYSPYRAVPKVDVPTNVLVMVAEQGPWSSPDEIAAQKAEVAAWARKMRRTVWIWTYPGKHSRQRIFGIPQSTPRAYGAYFKEFAPYIFGSFCESESDASIFNYLNYYVFSRVAWDPSADVDAVLAEHHRLMFGAAADEMARFFDALEDKWLHGVVGTFVEAEDGVRVRHYASELELYNSIYTPETLRGWGQLFDAAAKKVEPGSLAARRLAFMRENFLSPIERHAAAFRAKTDVATERRRRAASTSRAMPLEGRWKTTNGCCTQTADKDVKLVSSASRRLDRRVRSAADGDFGSLVYTFPATGDGALLPGHRYRVSCFVRMKGVRPLNRPYYFSHAGGFCFGVSGFGDRAVNASDPNYFVGDADWMAQSVEFTMGEKAKSSDVEAYARFYVADGTVWVDGFRVEELSSPPASAGEGCAKSEGDGSFELAADGKAVYAIVADADAPDLVKFAAWDLARVLHEVTDAKFPVSIAGEQPPGGLRRIEVGTRRGRKLAGEARVSALGYNGSLALTAPGGDIALVGSDEYGVAGAVYGFLQKQIGCRWYTPAGDKYVPKRPRLALAPFADEVRPACECRWLITLQNLTAALPDGNLFQLRNGFNTCGAPRFVNLSLPPGVRPIRTAFYPTTQLCHTFFMFVPPHDGRDYFGRHPEWFTFVADHAKNGGKRVDNRQLCFSNPGLRAELTKNFLEAVKAKGGRGIFNISAMDLTGPLCECPACLELVARYDTPGAPLCDYIAEVARELKRRFPEAWIDFLAYRREQTQRPPNEKFSGFPGNVIVTFAPIDLDIAHAIDHPNNRGDLDDLTGWRRLVSRIWTWYYPLPYSEIEGLPYSGVRRAAKDLRLMMAAGMTGAKYEHDVARDSGTGFYDLHAWVLGRLFIDPDLDEEVLVREFFSLAYGAAADDVWRYWDELERLREANPDPEPHNVALAYAYTPERILGWQRLFDAAEEKVKGSPDTLQRLREVRIGADLLMLSRYGIVRRAAKTPCVPVEALYTRLTNTCQRAFARRGRSPKESGSYHSPSKLLRTIEDYRMIAGAKNLMPAELADVPVERIVHVTPDCKGGGSRRLDASDAVFGHVTWNADEKDRSRDGFPCIIYDPVIGKQLASRMIRPDEMAADGYRLYRIGRFGMTKNVAVFFGRTWKMQRRLGEYYRAGVDDTYDLYVSLKFEDDPSYPGVRRALFERAILVRIADLPASAP